MINIPKSTETEEAIISACLSFKDSAQDAACLLSVNDFWSLKHQRIFRHISNLSKQGVDCDAVSVIASLRASNELDDVGGAAAVIEITNYPVPGSFEFAVQKIKESRMLREVMRVCQEINEKCSSGETANDVLSYFQNQALKIGNDSRSFELTSIKDLSYASQERYEGLRRGDENQKRIKTGYGLIDFFTGGFFGSKLIIIAARPSIGKTAWMCNLIENMASNGHAVGVFSLEMDKEALDDRWVSSLTGITSSRLSSNQNLTQEEYQETIRANSIKSAWNVLIDDSGGITIDELCRRCRRMAMLGSEIIFIDQLSFIKPTGKKSIFESNTEHVEAMGRLKKELKIPIVLLAQLNRDLEKRPDKKPMLSDLKNTGMLEEAADMVFLGFRKHYYTRLPEDENHAEWTLAKNRSGPTGSIEMHWVPKLSKFTDIDKRQQWQS